VQYVGWNKSYLSVAVCYIRFADSWKRKDGNGRRVTKKKTECFLYCFLKNSSFIAKETCIFQHVSKQLPYSSKLLEKHNDKLTLSREISSVKFGGSIQYLAHGRPQLLSGSQVADRGWPPDMVVSCE